MKLPFKQLLSFVITLLSLQLATPVHAQSSATGPHIQVSLLSEQQALVPGKQAWLGVLLEPEAQWHTYWRNPGDSGEAPTIQWQANGSLSFGDIQWPLPQAIPVAHLTNYGYEGANLLMVPVQVSADLNTGENIQVSADLSWLVCKEDCIPGWATLNLSLPVAAQTELSTDALLFENTRANLPSAQVLPAKFEITDSHIVLSTQTPEEGSWNLFPFDASVVQHSAEQTLISKNGESHFTLARSDYFDASRQQLDFLLSDGKQGYYLNAQVNILAPVSSQMPLPLWLLALMAVAGGLILNLMPCVLPVLSIKALALQHESPDLKHKLAYLFGVLASFNLFALSIILLRQSGEAVGWGFHMQSSWVIAILAFLFVFIALILLDVMVVGNRLAGLGQSLVTGQSARSHFFTGVLAVVVASPCTAPFMAASMGVAMVSPAWITLLLFSCLAIGFALPLTLLFWSPSASRWLPKPGAWMNSFKQFLAFPMLATVIWLVWVFQAQAGDVAQIILLSSLLLFAMGCWLSSKLAGISRSAAYLTMLTAIALPLSINVNPQPSQLGQAQAYSSEALNQLKQEQQVVLVNMTADWCITCKVNEQVALTSSELNSLLAQQNVHYLIGDWTNKNQAILNYLNQYQRAGVPLYVVYAGNVSEQVLPQILTPELVINAIQHAQQEINNAT